MRRRFQDPDENDEDDDDSADLSAEEWSSESADDDGYVDDGEPEVVDCPYCGARISEDAEQCPKCRNYISHEDAPRRRPPMWIIVGIVLAFLSALVIVITRNSQ